MAAFVFYTQYLNPVFRDKTQNSASSEKSAGAIYLNFLKIRVALCPPNPKALLKA